MFRTICCLFFKPVLDKLVLSLPWRHSSYGIPEISKGCITQGLALGWKVACRHLLAF